MNRFGGLLLTQQNLETLLGATSARFAAAIPANAPKAITVACRTVKTTIVKLDGALATAVALRAPNGRIYRE